MGILGGLIGEAPTLQTVDLDPTTKKLIGDQYQHATQSVPAIAQEMNQGVGATGNQFTQSPEQASQTNAQFGGVGYGDAIRQHYNSIAGKNIQNVIKDNENQASIKRAQYLKTDASNAMAQRQVETQNYEMQMKAMMDAEAARAQMLASVLGVGGMAAGMYAASGPSGGLKSGKKIGTREVMANEGSIDTSGVA